MGTALTIGKFNGFHNGHRVLLKAISDYAGEHGVDAICYKLEFGDMSILDDDEQSDVIKEYNIKELIRVPFTPEFAAISAEAFIRDILIGRLNAEYIVVGRDFRFGKNRTGDVSMLESLSDKYGYTLKVFDKVQQDGETVSSTRIKGLLEEGNVIEAGKLLGSPYSLSGKVGDGKKLGRSLGFPTINLVAPKNRILPRFGVYASRTFVGDRPFNSITNVGTRPSVDDGDIPNAETFIYDFDEDIYGESVKVELLAFIRDEIKFKSLDQLKKQINSDILQSIKYQ